MSGAQTGSCTFLKPDLCLCCGVRLPVIAMHIQREFGEAVFVTSFSFPAGGYANSIESLILFIHVGMTHICDDALCK